MIAMLVKMFQPQVVSSGEDLKSYINRLFIIISRSKALIERFERRLGGLSESDADLVIGDLD